MASRKERRKSAQKNEQARIWGASAAVAMALVPSIVPRLPIVIIAVLGILWGASWRMARDGYKYHLPVRWALVVMIFHGFILGSMGYWIWPKITVNPLSPSFEGYPGETFNFSVRNGRADDVYDVQIPFFIGYGKHLDSKFSVNVMPNGDPPHRVYGNSNYCYGKGADVHNVLPNEQEVLIVNIDHIAAYGSRSFSITYAGGESIQAKGFSPTFLSEPKSYSDLQGTVGVRGDYRICRYDLHTDGLVKQ